MTSTTWSISARGPPSIARRWRRRAFAIDSMYHKSGYYAARTTVEETAVADGVDVTFHVEEGARVVISEVRITGNTQIPDKQVVAAMASKPEGFWWFRDGRYDERRVDEDVRDNLPTWYGQRGLIDFQVEPRHPAGQRQDRQGGAPARCRRRQALRHRHHRPPRQQPVFHRGHRGGGQLCRRTA